MDSRRLATAGTDDVARIWSAETGTLEALVHGHDGIAVEALFSDDGHILMTRDARCTYHFWNLHASSRTPISVFPPPAVTRIPHLLPGSRTLALVYPEYVYLWDIRTGNRKGTLGALRDPIRKFAYSRDGNRLATQSASGELRLWEEATAKKKHTLPGYGNETPALSFPPDGTLLAGASSESGSVLVWDTDCGEIRRILRGDAGRMCLPSSAAPRS
jgi:WD40 repeat protein